MGKKEEEVDPQAFIAGALIEAVKQLSAIKKLQESMIEEGIIEPLDPKTITTTPTVVTPPNRYKPWFGVKITNDGPNSVYVVVNTKHATEGHELKLNETWGVKFNTAVIEDLYLYTRTGTAVVRIRGSR